MKPVRDREHLDYVSKMICFTSVDRRRQAQLPLDPLRVAERSRISDPHHLPSVTDNRRRTCDWWTVPLSREEHSRIDTEMGRKWERENLLKLYRCAALLLYYHGRITREQMLWIYSVSDLEGLKIAIHTIEEGAHEQKDVVRQKEAEPLRDEVAFQDAEGLVVLPNAIPKPAKRQSKWRK
jgi:hypothetical protein